MVTPDLGYYLTTGFFKFCLRSLGEKLDLDVERVLDGAGTEQLLHPHRGKVERDRAVGGPGYQRLELTDV